MFRGLCLVLYFGFAMGIPDPMGHKGPPLMVQADKCCVKGLFRHDDTDKDMLKECFQMDKKPHTCDLDICIATKKGYASSDGTIDKKVLQENFEKDFKDNTVALEALIENCLNGDLSKFGQEDTCELSKMNRCIVIQVTKSCEAWIESEDCTKLKTSVDSLIQKFD